uniref:Uncharacterized protein n=1 Tax=Cucumis melo TaxID=3656 RepID=A0A9I9EFZ8_CUCME
MNKNQGAHTKIQKKKTRSKFLRLKRKSFEEDKQIGIQVEECDKPIKEEITYGNKIDKNTFKLEIVRLKLEKKSISKMEDSDPIHESLHNIRDVKIKDDEGVEEENTSGQTYLNKLETLNSS